MLALGFGVLWFGYSVGLYGWTQLKGYVRADGSRISFADLIKPPGYDGPWAKVIGKGAKAPASGGGGGLSTIGDRIFGPKQIPGSGTYDPGQPSDPGYLIAIGGGGQAGGQVGP
jgi:hypothetical protein